MKIANVDIDDDIAAAVNVLWPDSTWSEVVNYALSVAVVEAHAADAEHSAELQLDPDTDTPGQSYEPSPEARNEGITAAIRWMAAR